jgi:CRISPR-associated protein Cmr6
VEAFISTKVTLDITNLQQDFQVFHKGSASPFSLYTLGDGHKKVEISIAIRGCRGATAEDVQTVWEWVQQALYTHGIGSRTSAGYGGLQAPSEYVPNSRLLAGYSRKFNFTLYSQGCFGIENKTPELRPTHWRGWLRSWCLRFFLGVMSTDDAKATVDQLFGTLGEQGLVRLRTTINEPVSSKNNPKFYRWKGTLELSAPEHILNEIILPIIKIAVRVGGIGRGWRRPLHRFILETKSGKYDTARGSHLELTRSRDDIVDNQIVNKADLGENDLELIYNYWKESVKKYWFDRYCEATTKNINAEVFSPKTCAVYLVTAPNRNPIDPQTLKWISGETTDTRGKGMELIYRCKYKKNPEVGGKISSCSWVSIKRVNGATSEDSCQEIVCIFMGNDNSLRSQFLKDLDDIPGAVHLFGRKPTYIWL